MCFFSYKNLTLHKRYKLTEKQHIIDISYKPISDDDTTHVFRLSAVNKVGLGDAAVTTYMTPKKGMYCLCLHCIIMTDCLFQIPLTKPDAFLERLVSLTSNNVFVIFLSIPF